MKITICGSMHFAKEMLEAQKLLEELGHEAIVPLDTHDCLAKPELQDDLEWAINLNIDKDHFNKIADSDAILVLNYPKNNIEGYIGGSSLMELAIARHLDKKIFILHDLPSEDDLRYALEIKVMKPIILNNDLTKIS
ncbi:MAG: hypothetical protein A2Y82_03785 [Candidatus Buchananbacteria bacterium RBG_13_36_9]|uniref:Maf-like protein n=1 Tax=Candidatus Buchananbacteria bacterium RBG_13_36_9 TaxID=1797530 RepID=A0A1G1XN14_9BACT|nr:MAG: hypothetical protein A2Y82_03785 [Candidatus Buchananbacteria bacterium RBG_13_36_9]